MTMSRVAVIGSNGQLGSDLVEYWSGRGFEVMGLTHADIQIEDEKSVRAVLGSVRPGIVLNTAAFHNVPQCESQPDVSFAVNGKGSLHLAQACEEFGATYVYYSTDYVFDGAKKSPYTEDDRTNPLNVYAATKLMGEYFASNYCRRAFVLRVSGIYGKVPCRAKGGNFVTTMVRLAHEKPEVKVVNDEFLTPTPTADVASATLRIVEGGEPGLYHVTSEGQCSWFEFAQVIFKTLRLATPLQPTTVDAFSSPVKRPHYSVLENQQMKRSGIQSLPHWREALISFLRANY
jgi:dTDP-4-dehydrorhamnose reductase